MQGSARVEDLFLSIKHSYNHIWQKKEENKKPQKKKTKKISKKVNLYRRVKPFRNGEKIENSLIRGSVGKKNVEGKVGENWEGRCNATISMADMEKTGVYEEVDRREKTAEVISNRKGKELAAKQGSF